MATFWHILKSTTRFGPEAVQRIWNEERANSIVTAGYGNEVDGPGRTKLLRYRPGDRVIVYAPGFGALALGQVTTAGPHHRATVSRDEHAHVLAVMWQSTVSRLSDAVSASAIKEAGGYTPRTLAMRVSEEVADRIAALLERAALSG